MSTSLKALVTRKKIVATDVVVDPNTKNRYFTETLNLSELANIGFATTASDGISVSESLDADIGSLKSDSLGISESITTHLTHQRQFSDSFTLSESLINIPNLGFRDTVVPEEVLGFDSVMQETDSFFMDERLINHFQPPLDDSPALTDVFTSVRTYIRDFADSFTLDDLANINSFTKNATAVKANIIGFSDSHNFATSKSLTETPTVTESISLAKSQPKSETITLSEVFAPVFTFDRDHIETVSVAENLILQPIVAATDGATVGDSDPILSIGGNYQDTATLSESHSYSQTKPLSDSATLSESISTQLTSVASAIFNTTPLNLFTLNQ